MKYWSADCLQKFNLPYKCDSVYSLYSPLWLWMIWKGQSCYLSVGSITYPCNKPCTSVRSGFTRNVTPFLSPLPRSINTRTRLKLEVGVCCVHLCFQLFTAATKFNHALCVVGELLSLTHPLHVTWHGHNRLSSCELIINWTWQQQNGSNYMIPCERRTPRVYSMEYCQIFHFW